MVEMTEWVGTSCTSTTETSGVSVPISPLPINSKYLTNLLYGTLHPHPFNSVKLVIAKSWDNP